MYDIFTYIWLIFMVNVGKYISLMDPMGMLGKDLRLDAEGNDESNWLFTGFFQVQPPFRPEQMVIKGRKYATWKAKCPIFKAIVAGFTVKVA